MPVDTGKLYKVREDLYKKYFMQVITFKDLIIRLKTIEYLLLMI